MKRTVNKLLAVTITATLMMPMVAWATNGYFAHGYGTKNKGLAGGGAALPQDSMIAATNPAGMVFVGNRLDVGAAIFSPNPRSYNVQGNPSGFPGTFGLTPGKVESERGVFLIPHFGRNWMLDANSSFGITVYGNGGMNTNYKLAGTFYDRTTGVNLEQLFIAPTYARKINEKASWGVTPVLVYQQFEAYGLSNFGPFSTDDTKLTANGADTSTGYGVKLGVQGEVSPGVTVAASYQSRMEMSEFDDYAGLFAEEGDFDIPATWTVGLALAATNKSVFTADIQRIYYSTIDSIANPIEYLTQGCGGGDLTKCLGGSKGAGFGWEDMTIVKLGYQWEGTDGYTWRVGVSKGEQPIPKSEVMFNILAPAVMEMHYTFGFTRENSNGSEFNFTAMYAPGVSLKGPNPLEAPNQQSIKLEMSQWELEGSWAIKF